MDGKAVLYYIARTYHQQKNSTMKLKPTPVAFPVFALLSLLILSAGRTDSPRIPIILERSVRSVIFRVQTGEDLPLVGPYSLVQKAAVLLQALN